MRGRNIKYFLNTYHNQPLCLKLNGLSQRSLVTTEPRAGYRTTPRRRKIILHNAGFRYILSGG
ncbi:MAG: hypothetical protein RMY28_031880 [Nostoc sp. ChiSLP01]|nr:hypothetical protein [Nostoc sp. ChiSLP01]